MRPSLATTSRCLFPIGPRAGVRGSPTGVGERKGEDDGGAVPRLCAPSAGHGRPRCLALPRSASERPSSGRPTYLPRQRCAACGTAGQTQPEMSLSKKHGGEEDWIHRGPEAPPDSEQVYAGAYPRFRINGPYAPEVLFVAWDGRGVPIRGPGQSPCPRSIDISNGENVWGTTRGSKTSGNSRVADGGLVRPASARATARNTPSSRDGLRLPSTPLNKPGKSKRVVHLVGAVVRPVTITAAGSAMSSGSISGSGLARANTIGALAILISARVRTPMPRHRRRHQHSPVLIRPALRI